MVKCFKRAQSQNVSLLQSQRSGNKCFSNSSVRKDKQERQENDKLEKMKVIAAFLSSSGNK